MQHTYDVFGLVIRSDFTLDALSDSCVTDQNIPVDITVRRTTGILRARPAPVDPFFDIAQKVQYLHWAAVGAFLIETPDCILVEPHADVSDYLVSQALLGLVISILLERRQILCLHASAVNIAGGAAVFLGDKGAGKSTTSAALLQAGHLPISDDLVAIEDGQGPRLSVRPGFSRMKLWPDTIAALNLTSAPEDKRVHPAVSKIQKAMPIPVPRDNSPVACAFVLKRAEDVRETYAEKLPPHEALSALLRYTFMARYGESKLGRDHLTAHMKRCSALVAQVPVYALHISPDLAKLPALCETIRTTTQVAHQRLGG
ncbi:hypothetical protein [Epibacterium ulvae]|uniref:hypothetical protein n=1 Tax=Epibacterium ulvae TaxID=1156985 RepID=UPI002492D37C|nr:hypothetical protein [Epibacterium ulvae]